MQVGINLIDWLAFKISLCLLESHVSSSALLSSAVRNSAWLPLPRRCRSGRRVILLLRDVGSLYGTAPDLKKKKRKICLISWSCVQVCASLPGEEVDASPTGSGGSQRSVGAQMGGRDWSCRFSSEGGKNGSRNTRERKGRWNKDLKLQCGAQKKEEMSGLRPGDVNRGWHGLSLSPVAPRWSQRWVSAVQGGGTQEGRGAGTVASS